jgi:nucleoside-diphosphate-sugar epimerase
MKFSIFGSNGFIGSNMVKYLKNQNVEYEILDPNDEKIFEKELGHVIYAIGITGDFRERYFDTVESHVCLLHKILKKCKFESFLYLSSTRIYSDITSSSESDNIVVNSNNLDNVYNISKLMGESLCLSCNSTKTRIARLSNVVGNDVEYNDFLSSIIQDVVTKKKSVIHTTECSEKDYIHIDDVVKILHKISLQGKEQIYNVGFGENTKVSEITNEIKKIINCEIKFSSDAIEQSFPRINIDKIQEEFDFRPSSFLLKLKDMILSQNEKLK